MPEAKEYRPLSAIVQEIRADWPEPHRTAKLYIDVMGEMQSIGDWYGLEPGDMVVAHFLGNARSWRGATAKRIKAELYEQIIAVNKGLIPRSGRTENPSH